MRTKTIKGHFLTEIEEQLKSVYSEFTPTMAIVFASVSQNFQHLMDLFTKYNITVFGASTAGEIIDNEVFELSAGALLFDIKKEYFDLFFIETENDTTYNISKKATEYALSIFKNPALMVVSGGLTTDGEQIIKGAQSVKLDIPLYGGLAGDDFSMTGTFVFTNTKKTNNGLLFLIIDQDHVKVNGISISGWDAIGTEKTITHAEGNIVYTIDNEPALDVFIKYAGLTHNIDVQTDVITSLGVQIPLQVMRNDGYSVIRAPLMGNDKDRSLIFAGGVPQGSKVKFSIIPSFEVVNQTINEIQKQKNVIPEADALVLFSCKARHLAFGPMIEEEITGIRKIWNTSLIGFFSYGEIGNAPSQLCDFHNETCSLVILKEL